jgi:hypothetical protein
VKLGALFGTLRSIEKGIGPDDKIIINGILRARPGGKVKAQPGAIDVSTIQLTAPGSPTTQALPMTRPFIMTTAVTRPLAPATTAPSTAPSKGAP